MSRVFTVKFMIVMLGVFVASTAFSYAFLSKSDSVEEIEQSNVLIDKALGLSLEGYYEEAFQILKPLADQDVTRAKLYLAVAYYHGNGVPRDIPKALNLFLDLQDKKYEPGIVNTYLNLIGSLQLH